LTSQGAAAAGPTEGGKVSGLNAAHHFATLLSLCHNVVVEDGKYMAESPDEEALVDGAVKMGLRFVGQTGDVLTIEEAFNSGDDHDSQDREILHHGNSESEINVKGSNKNNKTKNKNGLKVDTKTRSYTLMAAIPFSSLRKRMSVLVKATTTTGGGAAASQDDGYWLYTKVKPFYYYW
jgi:magnesium-transporting ATPase (P-type)